MKSRKANPMMPIGMVPRMTYHPMRWSRVPRSSGLNSPTTQPTMIRQMSRTK